MNIALRSKGKYWPEEAKNSAIILRKDGLSYGEITKILGVSKSTLFSWIGGMKRPGYVTANDVRLHLKRIRKLAASANKHKRTKRLEKIKLSVANEVSSFPLTNIGFLKGMLAMLYWAEGAKSRGSMQFANTDPKLTLLFITLLRKTYQIDESKLRIRLHLHYYHKIKESRKFWSDLLQIPESKFGKIYIKKRSKTKRFRKNFAGICFVRYYSEDLRFEILNLGDQIANKIVPVA